MGGGGGEGGGAVGQQRGDGVRRPRFANAGRCWCCQTSPRPQQPEIAGSQAGGSCTSLPQQPAPLVPSPGRAPSAWSSRLPVASAQKSARRPASRCPASSTTVDTGSSAWRMGGWRDHRGHACEQAAAQPPTRCLPGHNGVPCGASPSAPRVPLRCRVLTAPAAAPAPGRCRSCSRWPAAARARPAGSLQ